MKNDVYEIIENFLSKDEENKIENILLNPEFPWYLQKETSHLYIKENEVLVDKNTHDSPGFTHVVFDEEKGPNSQIYGQVTDILFKALNKQLGSDSLSNLNFKKLIRIKTNLTLKNLENKEKYHRPHIDFNFNHKTLIYYANDTDGYTYIFDNKYDGKLQELKILDKIKPKKGTALIFNGLYYHSSSNPVENDFRAIINYNFETF